MKNKFSAMFILKINKTEDNAPTKIPKDKNFVQQQNLENFIENIDDLEDDDYIRNSLPKNSIFLSFKTNDDNSFNNNNNNSFNSSIFNNIFKNNSFSFNNNESFNNTNKNSNSRLDKNENSDNNFFEFSNSIIHKSNSFVS
jgi:hypothetical protein